MVIYEWPGKFALVTEQRCGSSLLNDISKVEDSPLIHSKIPNLDQWISEYKETNKPIYVLCRDIHHKRSSAVHMQLRGHYNYKDGVNFLNGIIHAHTKRKYMEVEKCKFFNFCLNDSHIDWGTSVYYHFLKSKGITNICLLWLQRPNLLESNITIEFLDNFLLSNFRDYPEIFAMILRQIENLKKDYDHNNNYAVDRMGMTVAELSHIVLLEAYNKAFRELTDHRHDVLKFSDWIWCEQFMNNTMISIYTSSGYDCPYTSTEVLDIVREKLDIMDMAEIKKREEVGSLVWWPGKRFMMLCSDVYNNRSPDPADTPEFLNNAHKALTNT